MLSIDKVGASVITITSDAAVSAEPTAMYWYFCVKTRASAENLLKPTQPNQSSPTPAK